MVRSEISPKTTKSGQKTQYGHIQFVQNFLKFPSFFTSFGESSEEFFFIFYFFGSSLMFRNTAARSLQKRRNQLLRPIIKKDTRPEFFGQSGFFDYFTAKNSVALATDFWQFWCKKMLHPIHFNVTSLRHCSGQPADTRSAWKRCYFIIFCHFGVILVPFVAFYGDLKHGTFWPSLTLWPKWHF